MGAWGTGTFENDAALDCANDLTDAESIREIIRRCLETAAEATHLRSGPGTTLLVAAEIVSTAAGLPGEELPEALAHWLPTMDHALGHEDVASLIAATARVRDPECSELARLWGDTPEYEGWRSTVDAVLARLRIAAERLG